MKAQEIKFYGKLPGAQGYEIRLLTFSDQVSMRKVTLDSFRADSTGFFELTTELKKTRQVFIETGFYNLGVFTQPGITYHLQCDSIKLKGEYRPLYKTDILPCGIEPDSSIQLNQNINDFNARYNDFVMKEFSGIYQRRNLNVIRVFTSEMDSIFGVVNDDFFGIYREYKIATLELAIAPTKKTALFRQYIAGRKIQYNHPEFMYFFTHIFEHQLTFNNHLIQRYEIKNMINRADAYGALIDSLGADTLLRNERVRELVFLMSLKELYYQPDFSQQNILSYLAYIRSNSKFPEHRLIASNLYYILTKLEKGYPAPKISLPSLNGDTVRLQDLQGKPVYLGFLNTLSFASLAEFNRMDSLYQRFGNRVSFVTVSLDDNPEVIQRFKSEKKYNWTFLYNGLNFNTIDAYYLKTLPLFILIDKNGNILQYPAKKPSEGMGTILERLLR